MEKKITFTVNEKKELKVVMDGFNPMEALGTLRYYEKKVWLQMLNSEKKQEAKNISSNLVVIGSLLCPTCNKRMDDKEMSVCSDAVHKWYEQISA